MNTFKAISVLIDSGYSLEDALRHVNDLTVETINISNIPTSSTGLISGDVWSNAGVLTIV